MIDEEVKDNMQNTNEASIGGLMVKATRYNPQESTYTIEGLSRPKDEPHVHSGDIMEPNNSVNREAYVSPNHAHYGPFYQHDFLTLTNFHPDLQMHQPNQLYSRTISTNQMNPNYTFPVENKVHYQPFGMISQAYQHDIPYQEFQYFVVIDFEATCDKGKNPHPQEIIEFPSVLVNSMTGQMEASFQTYVRPAYHQLLTDFCKELTGIQQIQVDRGVPLSEALLMHDRWLEEKGIKNKKFAVVTWSNWDCSVMLESECRFKSIRKPPYFNRWINLRVPFHKVFGDVRCNLKEAVQLAGLVWEGRAHCGFDDACNTARLLISLMHRGFRFSITNSQDEVSGSGGQPGHAAQFPSPSMGPSGRERGPPTNCHCGVRSSESMIRKPGPTQGRCFFGCGNWTVEKRAVCNYFVWASP